jgi:hypothetical protein
MNHRTSFRDRPSAQTDPRPGGRRGPRRELPHEPPARHDWPEDDPVGYAHAGYDDYAGTGYPGVGMYEGVGGYPGGGRVGAEGYRGGPGRQSGGADVHGYDEGAVHERPRPRPRGDERERRFAGSPHGYHAGYRGDEREYVARGYGEGGAYWMRPDEDDRSSIYGSAGPRVVGGGHRGKGPKGYVRSDERIREDLSERLAEDDAVDPSEVSVEVRDGVVTLSGTVEQRWVKHRIEDMAEACRGVTDVINNLRVAPARPHGGGG